MPRAPIAAVVVATSLLVPGAVSDVRAEDTAEPPAPAEDAPAEDAPAEDAAAADAPPDPDAPSTIAIVYEGATGGLSGATTDLSADAVVAAALGDDWSRRAAGWGAFLQDGRWLLQADGAVASFRNQLAPDVTFAGDFAEGRALLADDYAVFVHPPDDALVDRLQAALAADPLHARPVFDTVRLRPLADDRGVLARGTAAAAAPVEGAQDPDRWEARLRTTFAGPDGAVVYVVSRLQGEGARRFAIVDGWDRDDRLYLAAGESIEGRSFLAGQGTSLQRPHTWAAWQALGLDALAVGGAELVPGIAALKEEAAAHDVTLLSVNLVDGDGNRVFDGWSIEEVASKRVALIGWTDPAALVTLPPDVRLDLRARGEAAVHDAVAELRKLDAPPDLVVLFGVGARELAGHLPGVTIVLGDFTTRLRLAPEIEVGEQALLNHVLAPAGGTAPVLVSRLGPQYVGRVELELDGWSMTRLRHQRVRVDESLPADPERVAAVQLVRQGVYAALEDELVPDLATLAWPKRRGQPAPPSDLDEGAFVRVAANLLMDRTGADLALLRPLPLPVDVPGPTQSLFVDASLAVADEVSVIELTGAQLKRLWAVVTPVPPAPGTAGGGAPAEANGLWGWTAGVVKSGAAVTVRGRAVQDTDVLYVATTSFFDQDPAVTAIVGKARVWRHFAGDGWRRARTGARAGAAWPLHELVKDGLVRLRDGDGDAAATRPAPDGAVRAAYARRLAPLAIDRSGTRDGRLTIELDGIAFQLTASRGFGDREGYANSQETRVNQANSFSTSLRGRFALVWDNRIGTLTAYTRGAFGLTRLAAADEMEEPPEPTELEDDLEAGAIGAVRLVKLPAPKGATVPLSMFLQSAFDTEFTPGDDGEGGKLPRQRILRTTAGATFGKFGIFREAKAGTFIEYDFSAEVGPVAPGVSLFGKLEHKFGPFKTTGIADFKGYFPTPVDTDTDLAFTLQLRADVGGIPFARVVPGLAIGGFVDALLFQGKLETNDQVGMHVLVGASLTYDADLRPPLRLR